ncbi:MAG: glycosyltransferase family 4 protein [Chloroflexota bacterium]
MISPLLFMSGEYPPDVGGVGDYTAHLRDALVDRGWPSDVFTRREAGSWNVRGLFKALRAAPSQGIVHIQFQAGAFDLLGDICLLPGLLRWRRPSVRTVTTFHDVRVPYLFPKAGPVRAWAVRFLARCSDAVIAADTRDLSWLASVSRDPLRCHRIPIGSNVSTAPPEDYDREVFRRDRFGASDTTLVLAYFGLLNASKGLDVLLDAFAEILLREPDVRLLLIGGAVGASDPTDRQTAERVRARLAGLHGRVVQTGWLPPAALSAYLLAADVALLPYSDGPSARRGSLLACAEHGLPIVSTQPAAPDVADVVLAVAPNSIALARAVTRLWRDPWLRHSYRARSRALAHSVSWSTIAAQHAALYTSLTSA